MTIAAKLTQSLSVEGHIVEGELDYTEGHALFWDEDIGVSETDKLVAATIDISQLKAIELLAEGGDMTLETNDGAAPDDTIPLVDGVPFVWSSQYLAAHFTADITAFYLTTGGDGGTLKGKAVVDPTI